MKIKTMVFAMGLVLIFVGHLAAKSDRAGEVIGDSLFRDSKYGYEMKIVPGWKIAKVGNSNEIRRISIVQRNPVVPAKFRGDQSMFTRPQVTILADSIPMPLDSLELYIRAQKGPGDLVKVALKNLALISISENVPEFGTTRKTKIGDFTGVIIPAQKGYRYNLNPEGGGSADLVADFTRGSLYLLQKDGLTLVIEILSERERYGFCEPEFKVMVESLKDFSAK